jgi:hypothetical protein
MATRSRTSFQKRQKEIARAEKQRDKLAKRAQRKLEPRTPEEELRVLDGTEPIEGFEDYEGDGPEDEAAEGEGLAGEAAKDSAAEHHK